MAVTGHTQVTCFVFNFLHGTFAVVCGAMGGNWDVHMVGAGGAGWVGRMLPLLACTHAKLWNSWGSTVRSRSFTLVVSVLKDRTVSWQKSNCLRKAIFIIVQVCGSSQEESSVPGAPTLWLGQRLG